MALLWADGFDHYGEDEDNLLDGVYASVSNSNGNSGTSTSTGSGSTTSSGTTSPAAPVLDSSGVDRSKITNWTQWDYADPQQKVIGVSLGNCKSSHRKALVRTKRVPQGSYSKDGWTRSGSSNLRATRQQ